MIYALFRKSSPKVISQVGMRRLLLAVLLKERNRLLLMLGYFFIQSLGVYLLSNNVLERATTQVYSNSTIILYFRIVVLVSPLMVGSLFGVPLLATEFESGNYRFLFTLGIGRRRLVKAHLLVYAFSILLFSTMTAISVNHFFDVEREAGPLSIWSFAVFICQPIVIIPFTLTLFMAGVFLGTITKRTVFGIATTLLFAIFLILGFQVSLEKVLFIFVQKFKTYDGSPRDAYLNFIGSYDSKYLFQFQMAYGCLLILISLLLGYSTLLGIRNGGIFYKKPKKLVEEGSNI